MCILDDLKLALIARFVVGDIDSMSVSDEKYLQQQFAEIKSYIEKVPSEHKEELALVWIKQHAEQYRREWTRKTFSKELLAKRCVDCPLIHNSSISVCIIHRKWVGLLEEYIADKISSDKYIEETLVLLNKHKKDLKVTAISSRM